MNIKIIKINNLTEYKPSTSSTLYLTGSRVVADYLTKENEAVAIELNSEDELPLWNGYTYFTINGESFSGHLEKIYCHIKNIPYIVAKCDSFLIREEAYDDLEQIYALYDDEDCRQYLEPLPPIDSVDKKARFESVKSGYMLFEYGMWIIEDTERNEIIGRIGFEYVDDNWVSIGFLIKKNQRKKGIAKKACLLVIEYINDVLPGIKITASCKEGNIASQKVLESVGIDYSISQSGNETHLTEI